jgi:hypothetical protein
MTLPVSRTGRLVPASRPLRLLLAVAALAAFSPAGSALAASPSGLVVVPHPTAQPGLSYFKLQARAGSDASLGAIELRNPTAKRLRVVLAAVDGETLGTLGSAYAQPGSRRHRSTLWLALGRRAVALAPRSSVSIPISVRIPGAAAAGDYLSGVSVEALDQRARTVARKGVSIASVARYAIGVEVSVPGPRRPLIQFTGAAIQRQPGGLTFLLQARNPGNVILQGVHGFVRITRAGHGVVARPIDAGTFVTQTRIAYPVTAFREQPTQGTRYRIVAWMLYAGGIARLDTLVTFGHRQAAIQQQYTHKSPAASGGTPWWKIAGVVAVILYALFTTILLLLRRRSRAQQQQPVPE